MSDKINYKPENIKFQYIDSEGEMQLVTLNEIISTIGFEYQIPDNVLKLCEMDGIVDIIATPNIKIVDSSSSEWEPFDQSVKIATDILTDGFIPKEWKNINLPENWLEEQEKIWIKRFTNERMLSFELVEGKITLEEYYKKVNELDKPKKKYPVGVVGWDRLSAMEAARNLGLNFINNKDCVLLYRPEHFCSWVFSKIIVPEQVGAFKGYELSPEMQKMLEHAQKTQIK